VIVTIDVEEWYDATAIKPYVKEQNSRIKEQIQHTLQLLQDCKTKATFFVLAKRAEENPEIIKWILDAGHEIGTHGYNHDTMQTDEEFAKDLMVSISILKKLGAKVKGYRAPDFKIQAPHAFQICKHLGIEYSSNEFWAKAKVKNKSIIEVPITTGGGYVRHMPLKITQKIIKNHVEPVIYLHPWELDKELPRVRCPWYVAQRFYGGIHTMEEKLRVIMS